MTIIGPIEKLGTVWFFEFFETTTQGTQEITGLLVNVMDRFERDYSRFLPDSIIGRLNAGGTISGPSLEFLDLLSIARHACDDTKGVFNIAVANHLEQSGYDAQYSFQSQDVVSAVPQLSDVLIQTDNTVSLTGGNKIDFGGFAKGYLIDLLADILQRQCGITYFLINGGGDMYVTSNQDVPIDVVLQHPVDRSKTVGTIRLMNQGFAASSPHVRTWIDQNGTRHNHLVSSHVKTETVSSFVVTENACQADIYATVASVHHQIDMPQSIAVGIFQHDHLHADDAFAKLLVRG